MRLYSGTTKQFLDDAIHNRMADLLKSAFFTGIAKGLPPTTFTCAFS